MSINTLKFSVAVGFACAATLGLTACSNSEDSSPSGTSAKETAISVEVLGKTVGDTLVFDMMDSTYDFKIEADGKWRIEDRTRFVQSIETTWIADMSADCASCFPKTPARTRR